MIEPGRRIIVDVEKPAAGGRMLARHDGRVVLVSGAIPGERVTIQVERIAKGVVYGETTNVLTPSPDRRSATDDWRCGGNVLSHISYPRQLALKAEIVRDAFTRIGHVPLPESLDVVGSPEEGYRMRARLHAQGGRLGFFREGTHQLCNVATTKQLLPSTQAWIASAEAAIARHGLTGLASVEIAENIAGDQRVCHLELHAGVDPARFAPLAEALSGLSAERTDRPGSTVITGTPAITDSLNVLRDGSGPVLKLTRDVRAFFQGNRFLLERLVRHVVGEVHSARVVDLYAGVGLFGLSIAASGADSVTLVEGDPISSADLQRNAEPFGDRVKVERRSVEAFMRSGATRGSRAPAPNYSDATFVVDPPRTGMTRDAVASIVEKTPARIVYVSCDPATLARDTRILLDGGFELRRVAALDLFPNTAHVETIATFSRSS